MVEVFEQSVQVLDIGIRVIATVTIVSMIAIGFRMMKGEDYED